MTLSPDQQQAYTRDGVVFRIPVYAGSDLEKLQQTFAAFREYPEEVSDDGTPLSFRLLREEPIWTVATDPAILDSVEAILGQDFYVWAARFISKEPRSTKRVVWHQDCAYWPLKPECSVTVWLAVYDATRANAAMRVISGSHEGATLPHGPAADDDDTQHGSVEIQPGQIDESLAIDITLRAGEMSLHDSRLVHGSPYNESTLPRCGLAIRYSRSDVKCDLSQWPTFRGYPPRLGR
jgi:non-heme Fe2+,alpha-ketoglutarate-dependent halogenase